MGTACINMYLHAIRMAWVSSLWMLSGSGRPHLYRGRRRPVGRGRAHGRAVGQGRPRPLPSPLSSSVCNRDDGGCVYTVGGTVSTSAVADRRDKGCTAVGDLERRGGIPAAGRSWPTPPRAGQTQVSDVETPAWAVVLAGGKGVRLSGLTRHVYGEDRPKQYAALTGGKSLLRQTLERVGVRIPSSRTVVVTMAAQQSYLAAEFGHDSPGPHVLPQPEDRGTAAAILLAAHWIRARDSEARLVVLPSDHFVADDDLFMTQVVNVLHVLETQPERIVLLGAEPTEPEADYGWIELGAALPDAGHHPVYRVLRFQEKPAQAIADQLFRSGALWNTSVFAGRAATLIDAGRTCLPSLHDRLARLATFLGTEHEHWALRQAYELAPPANFSRAVLERSPQTLAVMRLSAVAWRDLGTPRRVIRTLDELGLHPDWLAALG